jgi:hypothetical protein
MNWADVPEAPIYEHRYPLSRENDVRFNRDCAGREPPVLSKPQTVAMQSGTQRNFRRGINPAVTSHASPNAWR